MQVEQKLAKTLGTSAGVKPRYGVAAKHLKVEAVAVFLVTRCWKWSRWRWSRVGVCLEESLFLVEGGAEMTVC